MMRGKNCLAEATPRKYIDWTAIKMKKSEVFRCWIDTNDRIISFHPMIDTEHEEFQSQEELMHYILDVIDKQHYRVQ